MASKTKQDNAITSILIGRCECDEMVAFPFFWAEDLIPYAKERKFNIIDLKGKRFCKEQVKKHVEDKSPILIFLNGHGDENSIKGYNQEPIITLYENDYLLKGRIAHILSCDNGKFIAQSCIDKGCKGFLGYSGLFHIETDYNSKKEEDMIANFFREAVNTASKILIDGGSVGEAYKKSQEIYKKNIEFCKKIYIEGVINFNIKLSDEQRDKIGLTISSLEENMVNQICL